MHWLSLWRRLRTPPAITTGKPKVGFCVPSIGDQGDVVRVFVANQVGVAGVTVGGVALTGLTIGEGYVEGVLGAHASGLVDVTVTNASGSDTLTNGFTYHRAIAAEWGAGTPTGLPLATEDGKTLVG